MTLKQWREGSFEIATQDGQVVVNGFVSDEFGIRNAGCRRPAWTVTHLASGMLVTPGTAGFHQLEMAMAFADRVAALADWSRTDRRAPGRELGFQVMAIWNELIVLDMAKVITDCYGVSAHAVRMKPKPSRSRRRA
jgi:hypothetical protein